jgi:hypothetical protein
MSPNANEAIDRPLLGLFARLGKRRLWQLSVPLLVLAACGGRGRGDTRQASADESTLGDDSSDDSGNTRSEDTRSQGTRSQDTDSTDPGSDEARATNTSNASTGEISTATTAPTTTPAGETSRASDSRTTDDIESTGTTRDRDSSAPSPSTTAPVAPDPPPAIPAPGLLPDDCAPRLGRVTPDGCRLGTLCDTYTEWVECSRSNSGRWNCRCSYNNAERVYEISDVQGVDTCAVAARFCTDYDLELGDEVCDTESGAIDQDGTDDACEETVTCGRPINLPAELGASARLVDITQANCWATANGMFECRCADQPGDELQDVEANSSAAACAAFNAYCRGAAPSTDTPKTCVVDRTISRDQFCSLYEDCAIPVATLDGAIVYEQSSRRTNCDSGGGDTSWCACYSIDGAFSFELPRSEASCEVARLGCTTHAELLPAGDVTCTPTSQFGFDGTACDAELDCRQPATLDGHSIIATGHLIVYCTQPAPSDPWRCSCASNDDFVVFEYGAPEQTSWDVCSAAPQGCLERMPVHLGIYGDYQHPPDPWSSQRGPEDVE